MRSKSSATAGMVRIVHRERSDRLGEGPLWSARDNALYWTDILACRLNRLDLATDIVSSWIFPDHIGWVIERKSGGLVAGVGRAVVSVDLDPFSIRAYVDLPGEPPDNRVNDAKADASGRIWAGTMPLDGQLPTGSLYRIDPDARVSRVDLPYRIANGPAIAPDGSFLLHTDSALRTIFRFAILPSGLLGPREPYIRFQDDWGTPDGMTFDAAGGLWVACWGGARVMRFAPGGAADRAIELPASQITSCTFGGPDLDRMFVTSAGDGVAELAGGALFEVDPGCRGLATNIFMG